MKKPPYMVVTILVVISLLCIFTLVGLYGKNYVSKNRIMSFNGSRHISKIYNYDISFQGFQLYFVEHCFAGGKEYEKLYIFIYTYNEKVDLYTKVHGRGRLTESLLIGWSPFSPNKVLE